MLSIKTLYFTLLSHDLVLWKYWNGTGYRAIPKGYLKYVVMKEKGANIDQFCKVRVEFI